MRTGYWLLICLLLCGCRQQMAEQPSYDPLEKSDFFEDGRSARPLVEGTVARGHLQDDDLLFTGMIDGKPATEFPFKVTEQIVKRGQERFNIFCSMCHGYTGEANGIVVERGFLQPPSFHEKRLKDQAHGYYFDVISRGYRGMPSYAAKIPPRDRWAIVAYIRALQLSKDMKEGDGQ